MYLTWKFILECDWRPSWSLVNKNPYWWYWYHILILLFFLLYLCIWESLQVFSSNLVFHVIDSHGKVKVVLLDICIVNENNLALSKFLCFFYLLLNLNLTGAFDMEMLMNMFGGLGTASNRSNGIAASFNLCDNVCQFLFFFWWLSGLVF